jgi:hypothetical protein
VTAEEAVRAALEHVIESGALDSDDLLWLDRECRAALAVGPEGSAPDRLDVERDMQTMAEALRRMYLQGRRLDDPDWLETAVRLIGAFNAAEYDRPEKEGRE